MSLYIYYQIYLNEEKTTKVAVTEDTEKIVGV